MNYFRPDQYSKEPFCDCYGGDLYFTETDSCHEAYLRGPCPPEHYLILPSGEAVAKCIKNICIEDGFVPYEGSCVELHTPCGKIGSEKTVKVSYTDFQLVCIVNPNRVINAPVKMCANGTRRNALGKCKLVFD